MPGTMIRTMHEATMMKAWSPDWNHWFRFWVATRCQLCDLRRWFGRQKGNVPESPPVSLFVPLKTAGAPTHAYDMAGSRWQAPTRQLGKDNQKRTYKPRGDRKKGM